MRRTFLAAAALAALACSGPAPAAPSGAPGDIPARVRGAPFPAFALKPGRFVDIGGRRLNLYCFGKGSPTVLMLAGGGWGAIAYSDIQPRLARTTRVCSYDRAGDGFSDLGPTAPPADQSTRDLEALIARADLRGPFVLVGWSRGGMESRAFAYRHPEQVAGMVTIDGSTFDYEERAEEAGYAVRFRAILLKCIDAARAGTLEADAALYQQCRQGANALDYVPEIRAQMEARLKSAAAYELLFHHLSHMDEDGAQMRAERRPLGDIPLRVMVAGYHFEGAAKSDAQAPTERDYVDNSYRIAGSSTEGRLVAVPKTGHGIQLDNPTAVVEVIEEVVARVRVKRGK